ncbi:hypothetical protein K458DRAFT_304889, partial [Lentithecium fluviatile CBS 122367]
LVIIRVGSGAQKKEFHVHRGLLRHHSIYFQDVIRNSSDHEVDLPHEDPGVFDVIFWVAGTSTTANGRIPLSFHYIVELSFFADSKGMEMLRNATLTLFYRKCVQEWRSVHHFASKVYSGTIPQSPLRRYLVDFTAET